MFEKTSCKEILSFVNNKYSEYEWKIKTKFKEEIIQLCLEKNKYIDLKPSKFFQDNGKGLYTISFHCYETYDSGYEKGGHSLGCSSFDELAYWIDYELKEYDRPKKDTQMSIFDLL